MSQSGRGGRGRDRNGGGGFSGTNPGAASGEGGRSPTHSYGGRPGDGRGTFSSGPHPGDRGSFAARGVSPSVSRPRGGSGSLYSALTNPSFRKSALPNSFAEARKAGQFSAALTSHYEDYAEEENRGVFGELADAALAFAGLERRAPEFDINKTTPGRTFAESYDFDPGDLLANALSLAVPPIGAAAKFVNAAAGEPVKQSLTKAPAQRKQSVNVLDGLSAIAPLGGRYGALGASLINAGTAAGQLTGVLDDDVGEISIDSSKPADKSNASGTAPNNRDSGRQPVRPPINGSRVASLARSGRQPQQTAPGIASFGLGVNRAPSTNRGPKDYGTLSLLERLYGRSG